jgi:SAM-dependent methyltransferase
MTILRRAEHRALEGIPLVGRVLDVGGEPRSEYRALFSGEHRFTTVNLSTELGADIVADLETPLPITDSSFDAAVLINVLEHIFEYRQLLAEVARVLVPGGTIVIVVPYLFPYHASPDDFHRYSASALTRALTLAGFTTIDVVALGSGVFSARYALIERLLPGTLQNLCAFMRPVVSGLDALLFAIARGTRRAYRPSDYALGYRVIATKA